MAIFVKDPAAVVDYAIDWTADYLAGQAITGSAWSVTPADDGGVRVEGSAVGPGRTVATLAGGRPGAVYRVTNRVQLSNSRSDERTLVLRVEDR